MHSRTSACICVLPCFLAKRTAISASGHPRARDALSQQQRLGHRSSEGRVSAVEYSGSHRGRACGTGAAHKRGPRLSREKLLGGRTTGKAAEEIASLLAVLRKAAGCLNQWRCSTFEGRAEGRPNRHAGGVTPPVSLTSIFALLPRCRSGRPEFERSSNVPLSGRGGYWHPNRRMNWTHHAGRLGLPPRGTADRSLA